MEYPLDSFVFYRSFRDAIEIMTPEDQLATLLAICDFALYGIEPKLTGMPYAVFTVAKPSIAANQAKREGGKLGGRPPKNASGDFQKSKGFQSKITSGFEKEKTYGFRERKSTETETVSENGSETLDGPEPDAGSTPVITLPLNTGEEFPVISEQISEWSALYPNVDVVQQLRNMRGWLLSNPQRRKTQRGIGKFVTNWLAKEQDRGGSRSVRNTYGSPSQDRRAIPSDADYLAWKEDSP